jgi:hypothetical protein
MSPDLERTLRAAGGSLPKPDAGVTRRARAAVVASVAPRRRVTRTFVALVAAIVVAATAGFGAGRWMGPDALLAAEPAGVRGAGFLPASGWNTFQKGDAAVAANVAIDAADVARGATLPAATLRSLPRRGVVVVASMGTNAAAARGLPLRLASAHEAVARIGGRALLVRRLRARVRAATVAVAVYFGSQAPQQSVVDEAQRQLARLVVAAPRVTIRAEGRQRGDMQWVEVNGTVASSSAGETVDVLARECGPKGGGFYRVVGGAQTVAGGSWVLQTVRDGLPVPGIPVNAFFRARWDGALSEPVLVRLPMFSAALWDRRARSVWALAASRPGGQNLSRKYVELQRKLAGTDQWVRVRRARLQRAPAVWGIDAYRARFPIRARGLTLRVFVPAATAAPCFLATASEPVIVP